MDPGAFPVRQVESESGSQTMLSQILDRITALGRQVQRQGQAGVTLVPCRAVGLSAVALDRSGRPAPVTCVADGSPRGVLSEP